MEIHHPCGWPNKKVALKIPDNFMVTCMDLRLNNTPYLRINKTEIVPYKVMINHIVTVQPYVCRTTAPKKKKTKTKKKR